MARFEHSRLVMLARQRTEKHRNQLQSDKLYISAKLRGEKSDGYSDEQGGDVTVSKAKQSISRISVDQGRYMVYTQTTETTTSSQ